MRVSSESPSPAAPLECPPFTIKHITIILSGRAQSSHQRGTAPCALFGCTRAPSPFAQSGLPFITKLCSPPGFYGNVLNLHQRAPGPGHRCCARRAPERVREQERERADSLVFHLECAGPARNQLSKQINHYCAARRVNTPIYRRPPSARCCLLMRYIINVIND